MALWDRITSQFIEIIEWLDDDHQTLVWRFPVRGQEIKNGAKLVVREGQSACFVNEGKLADVFGPGTYTLTTQNLPILATLKGWKYGFNSPFKAEVYFVSATEIPDLKWGTKNPIMMRDPEFGPIRIRAFGQFSLRVSDPSKFLRTMSGTDGRFEVDEILGQVKGALISRFTEALAAAKIAALDLAGNYGELSKRVRPVIISDFEDMGLSIPKFIIENISLPENVEKMIDKRSEMAILGNNMQQYTAYQMANAIPDAARTPNSLAGAGMGLAAGMNMANQFNQQMPPPGYGPPPQGYGPGPQGYAPPPQAYTPAPVVAPAAPAAPSANDMVERIRKLDALRAAGVLTEEEYNKKKTEILSQI